MAKPRVYELAKVLNVDSKTVLEKLKDMGEFVKSASSTIEPPVARRLKAEFAKDNAKADSGRSRTSGIACLGTSTGSDSGCTDTASAGRRTPRHADPRPPRSERQP